MKFIKYFAALSAMAICSMTFASSHNVKIEDLGGTLTIGGKAGVEFTSRSLKLDGVGYYGAKGTKVGIDEDGDAVTMPTASSNNYDLDLTVTLDYVNSNSWFMSKLRANYDFANSQFVTRDGTSKNYGLLFEEAYFGMNLYEDGASTLNFNIGRRQLANVYNSLIQFDKRTKHDGISFTYMNSFEALGDFYATASKWVKSESNHWYPYGVELGLHNIMDSGVFAHYSYVSWQKKVSGETLTTANYKDSNGSGWMGSSRSRNSQITAGYVFGPELIGVDWKIYGAYLINHAVKKNADSMTNLDAMGDLVNTGDKKENSAYYVGTTFGKLDGASTWMLDINYQNVKQNAILESDLAGIGRYNKMGPNYKGFQVKAAVAFTDNMHLCVNYMDAKQANKSYSGMIPSTTNTAGAMKRHLKRVTTELWYHF